MIKKSASRIAMACFSFAIIFLALVLGTLTYYNSKMSGELIGKIAGCENCRRQITYFTATFGMDKQFSPDGENYYLFKYEKYLDETIGEDLYTCTIDGEENCFGVQSELAFPVELEGKIYYFLIHPLPNTNSKCLIKIYEANR